MKIISQKDPSEDEDMMQGYKLEPELPINQKGQFVKKVDFSQRPPSNLPIKDANDWMTRPWKDYHKHNLMPHTNRVPIENDTYGWIVVFIRAIVFGVILGFILNWLS